jgi:site-specific recombinase XerD
LPLFDSAHHLDDIDVSLLQNEHFVLNDFQKAQAFLKCYLGSQGTFNSYRLEIERLLHWSWIVAKKPLNELKREDIESFVRFCHKPPKSWIGVKKLPWYIVKDAKRVPNPEWRPFVATVSKAAHRSGQTPDPSDFTPSQGAIKEVFAILSSFYLYLLQDEYVYMNPVALIRAKLLKS